MQKRFFGRPRLLARVVALGLSWIFTATTVWATAPPRQGERLTRRPSGVSRAERALHAAGAGSPSRPSAATPAGHAQPGVARHGQVPRPARPVLPVCDCVTDNSDGTFTAFFGYRNDNDHDVDLRPDVDSRFEGSHRHGPGCQHAPRFHRGFSQDWKHGLSVVFDGRELIWVLRGPDGVERRVRATRHMRRCGGGHGHGHGHGQPSGEDCDGFFGPKQYVRTAGPKNVFTETITVPATVAAPFTLHVTNGEPNGSHRVSSAWIEVNGVGVLGPADFNQGAGSLERPVALTPTSTLKVTLASAPGSFLTISLCGSDAQLTDQTPPTLTWLAPAPGSLSNDATPQLNVGYVDQLGAGETEASGVDVATLKVYVDDVDRTALFEALSDHALADWPADLALGEGTHRLRAEVQDHAGNSGNGAIEFRVDVTPPTITIVEPAGGAHRTLTPTVRVQYADDVGLDLTALVVSVDGADVTSQLTRGAAEGTGTLSLSEGPHAISATIRDGAGNQPAQPATTTFSLDVTGPTLVVQQPTCGGRVGAVDASIVVAYSDPSGVDLGSLTVLVDAAAIGMSAAVDRATGQATGLVNGLHSISARVKDVLGNETVVPAAPATCSFQVDAEAPHIQVTSPVSGSFSKSATVPVLVEYWDNDGIDLATLHIFVGGSERTSDFVIGPTQATATLTEVADGVLTVTAQVSDWTSHGASASSTATVDTVLPNVDVVKPGALASSGTVAAELSYDGTGTAIDLACVEITLDGENAKTLFALGGGSALATLTLADGLHTLHAVVCDQAGNRQEATRQFRVDSAPPRGSFSAPSAFTSDTTPNLRLSYEDDGAGVDASSVRVFLSSGPIAPGGEPPTEAEITALFTRGASEATATLPDAAALAEGPHRLRATLSDQAGHAIEVQWAFEVDAHAPSYAVSSPANGKFVPTGLPSFVIDYSDDRSGVDTSTVKIEIDGVDQTAHFTLTPTQATGVLPADEALSEGRREVAVALSDRAGNAAVLVPHAFIVDTTAPTVSVDKPANGSTLPSSPVVFSATYSDADAGFGNAIDTTKVRVRVDGADRTAELSVGAGAVEGSLTVSRGNHTVIVDVADLAGNPKSAQSTFTVAPAVPPTIQIVEPPPPTPPASGTYLGTLTPTVRVTYGAAAGVELSTLAVSIDGQDVTAYLTKGASEAGGTIPAAAGLTQGQHTVVATINDVEGTPPATPASREFHVDVQKPVAIITEPQGTLITGEATVTIAGHVDDASPVVVSVAGQPVSCGGGGGACTFSTTVTLSEGVNVISASATDAAGNVSEATPESRVPVVYDHTAPDVIITSPQEGTWVAGPNVAVTGTVTDATPVTVEVNGQPATVTGSGPYSFSAIVPLSDGENASIAVTARDAAVKPNERTVTIPVKVDSIAPAVFIDTPQEGEATAAATIHVSGRVVDSSPVTATIRTSAMPEGLPLVIGTDGSFEVDLPLPEVDGGVGISVAAQDQVGHPGTGGVGIVVDRTAPDLRVVSPTEGAVVLALPLIVEGTVTDATDVAVIVGDTPATRTGNAWQASLTAVAEGPQTIHVTATDKAGNATPRDISVRVDLAGPSSVTIDDPPASGLLTRAAAVQVTGRVMDSYVQSVTVNGTPATITQQAPGVYGFMALVPLVEGENPLSAVASDGGHPPVASPTVRVTRDTVPPEVALTAPASITRAHSGLAVATASDTTSGILRVSIAIDGVVVATFDAPPYEATLNVPEGAEVGKALLVTATAVDRAGNSATTTPPRSVTVTADGVVIGLTLDDTSSLPVAGATARIASRTTGACTGTCTATTDAAGRYSLPTAEASAVVTIERTGFTSVERDVAVVQGVGTVAVDARLTPLASRVSIGAEGGAVQAAQGPVAVNVDFPPGALASATDVRLTLLSQQGLPALLPLGWSPRVALDLRAAAALEVPQPLSATAAGLAGPDVQLVEFSPSLHAWILVAAGLTPSVDGTVAFSLPSLGSFALVVADPVDPPLALPAPQAALPGLDVVTIPDAATSIGRVDPAIVSPAGGTAHGTLVVSCPTALPSGTVVQALVSEIYAMANGEESSREKRTMDILVYRESAPGSPEVANDGTLPLSEPRYARVPITPSITFGAADVTSGRVRLEILSGRESVRGTTGGHTAVTARSADQDAMLRIAGGALADETAVSIVRETAFSSFLPTVAGVDALAEVTVDLSGQVLATAAELSAVVDAGTGGALLVVKVDRSESVPRLAVVALAAAGPNGVTTMPGYGLPGVLEGGRYIFYRVATPVGVVSGRTLAGSIGTRALVVLAGCTPASGTFTCAPAAFGAGWPFIAATRADGSYAFAIPAGSAEIKASVPRTSLLGTATATVAASENVALDIVLAGAVTTATVSPQDGETGVALSRAIEVTPSAPIRASSLAGATIRLFDGDPQAGQTVPVRVVLSTSGRGLTVIPYSTDAKQTALKFSTNYALEVSGLLDIYNGAVVVPATRFRTKDNVPPAFDPELVTFSMPIPDHVTRVTVPACTAEADWGVKCLYPGTNVLIINATSGMVLSLTAGNDGEINATNNANETPATINDVLVVTVTDPFGNSQTFRRSQFNVLDASGKPTGETAVGAMGGVVRDPEGKVELRIPEGALNEGTVFKLTPMDTWDSALMRDPPDFGTDDSGERLAHFGSGVQIHASKVPHLNREARLAFRIPQGLLDAVEAARATRPDAKVQDAFFEVLQRMEEPCPDGTWECDASQRPVFYTTMDFGRVEGDVASGTAKIVTASYPFTGFKDGWARWDPRNGATGGGPQLASGVGMAAFESIYTSIAVSMWLWNAMMPGQAVPGVITGRVIRPVWEAGAAEPAYKGVGGRRVRAIAASGDIRSRKDAPQAITQDDGRFTYDVARFITGQATVVATDPTNEQEYTAPVYMVATDDTKLETDSGLAALHGMGVFDNVATANIVFPPLSPPQPSAPVRVVVMTVDGDGKRQEIAGTAVEGVPLLIGFDAKNAAGDLSEVTSVAINTSSEGLTIVGDSTKSNRPVTYLMRDSATEDGRYVPDGAGTYTIVATATPSGGGAPVNVAYTLRVVTEQGGVTNLPGVPPRIMTGRTRPASGAKAVPTTTYVEVAFTEPVKNVAGNLRLLDGENVVPVKYMGVLPSGTTIDPATDGRAITAVTLAPISGLRSGAEYTIDASSLIVDEDNPPKPLDCSDGGCTSRFTTFAPADDVGSGQPEMRIAGLAVLEDRAYAAETLWEGGLVGGRQQGQLRVFNIEDPTNPVALDLAGDYLVNFPLEDVAAEAWGQTTGEGDQAETAERKIAAVVTSSRHWYELEGEIVGGYYYNLRETPTNLLLFDVETDAPKWIGATSLSGSLVEGGPKRVVLKGGYAYVATLRMGLQVVSLNELIADFPKDNSGLNQLKQDMSFGGRFAGVATTRLSVTVDGRDTPLMPVDLEVESGILNGASTTLAYVVGWGPNARLSIVSPFTQPGTPIWQDKVKDSRGSELTWGYATGFATVDNRQLLLIGGDAKIVCDKGNDPECEDTTGSALFVVDVTNPGSPQTLGVFPLTDINGVGDVLVTPDLSVIVSSQPYTSGGGTAVIVGGLASIVGGGQLKLFVAGTLANVGSRLALSKDGILVSTDRVFISGVKTSENGVHMAALKPLALVETDPFRVVVGEGPRAAEKFKLVARMIPSDFEVKTAEVQFRIGDATHSAVPLPVDENGPGSVEMEFGFTYPRIANLLSRARLVVNKDTPAEVVGPPRRWRIEQPEVQFVWGDRNVDPASEVDPKVEEVTADYPQIDVQEVSAEWHRRFDDLTQEEKDKRLANRHGVAWEARTSPAKLLYPVGATNDGIVETVLDTGTVAGLEREVVARVLADDGPTDVVLGTTDPLTVQPGAADEDQSTLEAASGSAAVPADGASELQVKLTARDQYGNLVADGTVVVWEKGESADGEFVEPQEATQNGVALVTYRAGVAQGAHVLRARVGDAALELNITQAPIGVTLEAPTHKYWHDRTPVELTVRVTSAAGPISDKAEIGWFVSIGRMEQTQPLANGEAKAIWHFGGISCRPKVKFFATLGQGRSMDHLMVWERLGPVMGALRSPASVAAAGRERVDPGGAVALQAAPASYRATSVEPMIMAGDMTADGTVPVENADGSIDNVFVKATGTYKVTGLVPGEHVRVRLGTNRAPNLVPVAHYTSEMATGSSVPDATGVHDGRLTGGVTVIDDGYNGQGLAFDGTGVVTVPYHKEFAFSDGFMVQTAVRPPPDSGAQVLIEKAADFTLALVEESGELRALFTIQTTTGPQSMTSLVPVPVGVWSVVTGKYQAGRLWIGIDSEAGHTEDFTYLNSAPAHSGSEIQIGPGFEGALDEVRLFDLTSAPLSTFAGGATELSIVADGSGEYSTTIAPTGQLGVNSRVARYYQNLAAGAIGLAAGGEPPPTNLQDGLGSSLIEVETYWDDTAERSTTWYGYCGSKLMGSMVKLTRGLFVGSEAGEFDLAVMAGDMLGSLGPLKVIGIIRDLSNAADRMANHQASGDDALNMASSLASIAQALTGGKVGQFLRIAKLAKALPAGSRSARTVAKLMAFETKLAAGAGGVSKVATLIDIVQAASGASQAVGAVLDVCGVHVDAIVAFNNIMANAPAAERQGVLDELKTAASEMDSADLRMTVSALGGEHATSGPSADKLFKPWFKSVTRETADGARSVWAAMKADGVKNAGTRTARIATNAIKDLQAGITTVRPEEVLNNLAKIRAKFNKAGEKMVAGLARRLGSDSVSTRKGERFVLSFIMSKLDGVSEASELAVEKLRTITVKGGKEIHRYYDAMVKGVFYECKAWNPNKWPAKFPPGKSHKPWAMAKTQWVRDIRIHGVDAQEKVRWVFPAEFLAAHPKGQIAEEFAKLLDGEQFEALFELADSAKREAILDAFGATVGPNGKRNPVNRKLIEAMLESHTP